MTAIKRELKTFDIDPNKFTHIFLKDYVRTYFQEGSLNISSKVPILILENIPIHEFSGGHFDICISDHHLFYKIFKDLSKDNIKLFNNYFIETSKIKSKINLIVYYDQKFKAEFLERKRKENMWCKIDIKVRINHYEGLLYEGDRDSEYIDNWSFRLDLNKIEFV